MKTNVKIFESKTKMGQAAAEAGALEINAAIRQNGFANIIVATGASQFEMLEHLVTLDVPWQYVTVFHLDEYIGIPITHPASFRNYLWNRFASRLPVPTAGFHFLDAETDPEVECARVNDLIGNVEIVLAMVGIGENGHLAFNDPPADFETEQPFLIVSLDEACRRQQLGEGWFPTLDDVPTQAISMSIRQIMKSKSIICTVPDKRKSIAVKQCVESEVTPDWPASILQQHHNCRFFLDQTAASKLS